MGRIVGVLAGAGIAVGCLLVGPAAAWPFDRGDATLRPGDVIVTADGARVVQADGSLPAFDAPGAASPALRTLVAGRLGPRHAAFWRTYAASRATSAPEPAPRSRPVLAAQPRSGRSTARPTSSGGFVALN